MVGTKPLIRQEMRRRRRALAPDDLHAAEQAVASAAVALTDYRDTDTVLAYAATDAEVPTGALIDAALAAGKRIYLPRVRGDTIIFAEHRRGAVLRPGVLGIPEPLGDELEAADAAHAIAFVPVVAWDETGSRVGRGGGHYDRAFSGPARPQCVVGLGYTFQQQPALPRDPWDLQLDWVITERGAVRCRYGDDPSHSRKEGAQHNGIPDNGVGSRRLGSRARLGSGLPPAPAGRRPGPGDTRSRRARAH